SKHHHHLQQQVKSQNGIHKFTNKIESSNIGSMLIQNPKQSKHHNNRLLALPRNELQSRWPLTPPDFRDRIEHHLRKGRKGGEYIMSSRKIVTSKKNSSVMENFA
ncbi:hypothetical protein PanWU01x14_196040, partial [Parasponia andersonii]